MVGIAGMEMFVLGIITLLLVGGTIGIGVLCWVWMRGSRASQARMEARNDQIVSLLRAQNDLLAAILDRGDSDS